MIWSPFRMERTTLIVNRDVPWASHQRLLRASQSSATPIMQGYRSTHYRPEYTHLEMKTESIDVLFMYGKTSIEKRANSGARFPLQVKVSWQGGLTNGKKEHSRNDYVSGIYPLGAWTSNDETKHSLMSAWMWGWWQAACFHQHHDSFIIFTSPSSGPRFPIVELLIVQGDLRCFVYLYRPVTFDLNCYCTIV